jgi:hypothetical protein
MRNLEWTVLATAAAAFSFSGCAAQFEQQAEQIENQPIDCRTAPGDLRVLQSEKAHVGQQLAMGVSSVYPSSLIMGVLTGTENTKIQVATGQYNQMIDQKIAQIEATCGVE